MNLIDMHCDTLWNLMDLGGVGDLKANDGCISIEKMREGGTKAQFFACFTDVKASNEMTVTRQYEDCWQKVQKMCSYLGNQISVYNADIAKACTYEEMQKNKAEEKISAILTVEEGGVLNGYLERLDELYIGGIRLITLMWNYENCIGYPNSRDRKHAERIEAFWT